MPLSLGLAAVLAFALPAFAQNDSGAAAPVDCSVCAAGAKNGTDCSSCPDAAAPKPRAVVAAAPPAAAVSAAGLKGIAGAATAPSGLGRAFDGGAGGESGTLPGAATYVPAEAAAGPATAGSRFSAAINTKLASVLAGSESGRRTLDRLRGSDGALKLPPVILVDLGGGSVPGRFDQQASPPTMELDQRNVAKAAVAAVPEGERAALKRKLSDPTRLAAYLSENPAALDAVAAHFDATFVHELTHAWQGRRDRAVDIGADREREPIEWELEAYREQLRYVHEKVMRDPASAADYGDMKSYEALLAGYDNFHDYVTALYSGLATGSFPRIEAALAKRKNSAKALADARATASDYDQREEEFIQNELPAIQKDGIARLLGWYRDTGRPDKGLALLAVAPDAARARYGPDFLAGTIDYVKKEPPAPIEDRLDAWQGYLSYLMKTTGGNMMPSDLFAIYRRDYGAASDEKAAAAAAARTPAERRELLRQARAYASYLPSPEKERRLKKLAAPSSK